MVNKWRKFLIYCSFPLVLSVIFHLFFATYASISAKNSLLIYLPTLLLLVALQYSLGKSLWHWGIVGHFAIGIIWAIAFVLFNFYGSQERFPFTQVMGNYLFGVGCFALLVFLQVYLASKLGKHKLWASIFTIFDLLLLIIPLAQLGYFWKYHKGLSMDSLFALYQTNIYEASEFLQSSLNGVALGILILGLIIVLILGYKINLALTRQYPTITCSKWKYLALVFFILVSGVFFFKTNVVNTLYKINDYSMQLKNYGKLQQAAINNLQLDLNQSTIKQTPGTIILVIGESAARDRMKVFNPKVPVDNTPWQSAMEANKTNFHFFDHAYTSWVQTVPSLQRALTEQNQYNQKDFLHSVNILNVANKMGYHTYWFSNQGMVGQYDTTTTLIAKTAQQVRFTKKDLAEHTTYDGELIDFLKTVPTNQNNFVVIHLMGSHLGYQVRYPQDFTKFKDIKYAAYYNTINYTDYVLQQIFDYSKTRLNLQAMVYFSDHAEDMVLSHNPDTFTFSMDRIPLWIYTSNEYNKAYPLTFKALEAHKDKYFTNDLLYDLMLGLLQAKGNTYVPSNDLLNSKYKYNENNLTTNLGKTKISEDPYLHDLMPTD